MDIEIKKKLEELEILPTDDGKFIMKLKDPVKWGDETINELIIVEPRAKHMRNMPGSPGVGDILRVCADLASQPDAFIDDLCLKDANRLGEFFTAFN
jgi:hypothetical protein